MKKVRRFYRRQDGVITTPSGVPVEDHLKNLIERKQEHCAEALCIKDILQKENKVEIGSSATGVIEVQNGDDSIVKVSWKIENLSVPSKKEINPLPPKPEYPETDTRNPKFWENKKRGK